MEKAKCEVRSGKWIGAVAVLSRSKTPDQYNWTRDGRFMWTERDEDGKYKKQQPPLWFQNGCLIRISSTSDSGFALFGSLPDTVNRVTTDVRSSSAVV